MSLPAALSAVILPETLARELVAHALGEAPRECCGVLIGRLEGAAGRILEVRRGRNIAAGHDLYELAPEDFVAADAAAEARGLAVIGFYHSHPRGPEQLSKVDRERAWPAYIYLLICPEIGSGNGISAWLQPRSGEEFTPLRVEG